MKNVRRKTSNEKNKYGFIPSPDFVWTGSVEGYEVIPKVYDVLGREVAILVIKQQKQGSYEVEWNPSAHRFIIPSGVYFYQLHVGEYIQTKKMLLLK